MVRTPAQVGQFLDHATTTAALNPREAGKARKPSRRGTFAGTEQETAIRTATELLPMCGEVHRRANDSLRRDYNQAWFDKLYVDSHDDHPSVSDTERTELFQILHAVNTVSKRYPTSQITKPRDAFKSTQ